MHFLLGLVRQQGKVRRTESRVVAPDQRAQLSASGDTLVGHSAPVRHHLETPLMHIDVIE